MTKQKKLRHNEYYDMQLVFDKLYADSKNGKTFKSDTARHESISKTYCPPCNGGQS